jgi:glutathione S-transferase
MSFNWLLNCLLFDDVTMQHMYMATGVMSARKKYGVAYPLEYANPSDNKNADAFNCVQRGHQNSLENLPSFLSLLCISGLTYPVSASLAGAVYLAGRVMYFRGYSTGDPKKRMQGGFLHLGSLALLGLTLKTGYDLLFGM